MDKQMMKKSKDSLLKHALYAHDKFFKMAMKNKRVAQEFFEAHLPKDILSLVDLSKLELTSESYIDDLRKTSIADMLFKTEMHGSEMYLYLVVDHQSRPDKLMPFRMLKYVCNIIDQHLKETGEQRIPLVLPFVLYHGKEIWHHSTTLQDLVDAPKNLVEDYFLKPFFLIDLNQIEDAKIKERIWLGAMELTLKHIFDYDIAPAVKEIMGLLKKLQMMDGNSFTEVVLTYILDRGRLENKRAFIEEVQLDLSQDLGEKMGTIVQDFWAEGWADGEGKGRQKEREEVAKRLLVKKYETLEFIAEVTNLSVTRIKELQEQEKHK